MKKLCCVLFLAFAAAMLSAATIEIRPVADKIWKIGETVDFTATALDNDGKKLASGSYVLRVNHSGGKDLCKPYTVDMAKNNPFKFSAKLDQPGFIMAQTTHYTPVGGKAVKWSNVLGSNPPYCGVPVEPEKIRAGLPAPDDFDKFWQQGIEKFKNAGVVIAPAKHIKQKNLKVFKVTVKFPDNSGSIDGFLAIPEKAGKYPLIAGVPGAGPGTVSASPAYRAGKPAIMLWMNVHTFPTAATAAEQKARYTQYNQSFPDKKIYCHSQAYDREKYIFRNVWLAVSRAVDYIVENVKEFDGKHVAFVGSSQGGGSALALSYLNKHTTCTVANVPALCDHSGWKLDRRSGWPTLHDVWQGRADESARYFDGANFALRIKTPVMIAVGFADLTCSPSSVYAAYNNLPGKKSIFHMLRTGHFMDKDFTAQVRKFLDEEFAR
ncbi:MAG: acetylxylan esterase [Lentisphaeria bacterium]|nr:acetylxylan esterase [Lentisphaeria bacterium]